MTNHTKEIIIRIALVLVLLLMSVLGLVLFVSFEEKLISFAFCIVTASAFVYFACKYFCNMRTQQHIATLTRFLDSLLNEQADCTVHQHDNERFQVLYKKIDDIKEALNLKEKNRSEILNIVNSVAVNMELDKLLEDLMPKLIDVTKSNCGAFYLVNQLSGKLEIKHSLGFSKNLYSEFDLVLGEGLVGTALVKKQVQILNDIPDDTVYVIRTFLGKIKPRSIMIVPIMNRDQIIGTLVFASIYHYSSEQTDMIELIKYYVGVAVGNGITYEKTKRLTNELKFQNRLIQNLNDDLEKKVQERTRFLNDIIDSIKDYAIYAMDKDGTVVTWNKGAELLLGYTADEVLGKNIEMVNSEDEIKSGKLRKRLETALKEGKFTESGWRFKKDGSPYFAEMILFARYDLNGEVIGMTNVTKDITTLKNVETALWFEKEFSLKVLDSSSRALIFADENGIIEMANGNACNILNSENITGLPLYSFFENEDELKKCIQDAASTASRGEWRYRLKGSDKDININISVMVNNLKGSGKLFVFLY